MPNPRVLVTGSRTWNDRDAINKALASIYTELGGGDITLVSGACPTGADMLCEDVWNGQSLPIERHPADWDNHGKRAGFVRNSEMVNLGATVCLAFIQDESKGATMTASLAEKSGIRTVVFRNVP